MTGSSLETKRLEPFGLEVRVPEGTPWDALPAERVHAWVAEHRLVVLRGLAPIAKRGLPLAARTLGPLQVWAFGSVNELEEDAEKKNYLYTNRAVPLHFDGAFAGRVPRYLFFRCVAAPDPDAGGATTFVDTTRVWARAADATRNRWRALEFSYETNRVVHYGGRFRARLVAQHPHTHETVLRFAEPVDDMNPVRVRAEGRGPLESAAMITELRDALHNPEVLLAHRWDPGDVVIADNHALVHGRNAFERATPRHILRVNVHDPGRPWFADWVDSLVIRRPEFMVAELPILLVPALLLTSSVRELATPAFAVTSLLFFLLFHFGDMTNCLADRELNAVYKTRLSEAVLGLGVGNVKRQIAATTAGALALAAVLGWLTGRWDVVPLVVVGLLLGGAYSFEPVRLKGRGLLQVLALWAVIFVGPMLLVMRALGAPWSVPILVLAGCYGAMQQGTILVNTAEDLPEDEESGVRTSEGDALERECHVVETRHLVFEHLVDEPLVELDRVHGAGGESLRHRHAGFLQRVGCDHVVDETRGAPRRPPRGDRRS